MGKLKEAVGGASIALGRLHHLPADYPGMAVETGWVQNRGIQG
jgi:hypothetical protein